ncbi:MAG: cation diffusion facilitator family transporter [Candidatus Omnitrophica bacterium]|nr:cation diffusion facilitator family transporter [Candidatus Omnitrophota bacterium]
MVNLTQKEKDLQVRVIRVSMFFSIAIFLIALIAGIISDSITLLLDASAGFITVFMAFVVHSNIKKLDRPPDSFFNFGYDKFEPFTVVMQGGMIMFSCVVALYFAIQDIVHAEDVARYDIPMIASMVSGVIALIIAFFIRNVSVRTRSHMLKASALHWFVDSFFSFAMVSGFAFGYYMQQKGYHRITPYVDPAMTIILATILIWTPIKLIKTNLRQLLDAAPSDKIRAEVEKIVDRHKARAFGIHSIRMREVNEKVFLYICFQMHGHITMLQAQEFVKAFEADVAEHFPKYDVIVYFYPVIAR